MSTAPSVWIEDELLIPPGIDSLEAFQRWVYSDEFPAKGRVDYLQGAIEVDMSPAELQSHGRVKVVLTAYIENCAVASKLGQTFVDCTRLKSVEADLSCEPDVLFVSWESLRSQRVRYRSTSPEDPSRLMEVEGAADLAVEVVSRSSATKDMKRLPPLYALAGVRELWLVDARRNDILFQILHLHRGAWAEAVPDSEGFRHSKVLDRTLRLRREAGPIPQTWLFSVEERPSDEVR